MKYKLPILLTSLVTLTATTAFISNINDNNNSNQDQNTNLIQEENKGTILESKTMIENGSTITSFYSLDEKTNNAIDFEGEIFAEEANEGLSTTSLVLITFGSIIGLGLLVWVPAWAYTKGLFSKRNEEIKLNKHDIERMLNNSKKAAKKESDNRKYKNQKPKKIKTMNGTKVSKKGRIKMIKQQFLPNKSVVTMTKKDKIKLNKMFMVKKEIHKYNKKKSN